MADCIEAQITANIKAKLKTITTANGYNYNVAAVEQQRKLLEVNNRWPFILLLENESTKDEVDNMVIRTIEYPTWFFTAQDDRLRGDPSNAAADVDTEIAYKNRNAIADITKALCSDDSEIYRDGNAELTEVVPGTHDYYEDDNLTLFGTWCMIVVTTRINARNPYELNQR